MKRKKTGFSILLILVLGALVRFWGLGAKSLRLEEWSLKTLVFQWNWRDFFGYFNELGYGWNPLNPFFCRLIRDFGPTEAILRLPSAFFGVAAIYVIYRLGKSLSSEETGIIAAILLAFSPMAVAWSQEGRHFSLALLLCLLSVQFLLAALEGRKGAWFGFVLVQGALLMTTYQGWTILVTEGIFMFLPVLFPRLRREDGQDTLQPFIYFVVSVFFVFLLLSPWFYYEVENDFRLQRVVVDTLLLGGSYKSFLDWGGGNWAGFLFCLFFFLVWLLVTVKTPKREQKDSKPNNKDTSGAQKRVGALLPVLLTGVPVIVALSGTFRRDQIFWGLPFFLLIAAEGMNQIPAIIRDKIAEGSHRRFFKSILPGILGGYILLQVVPFYNVLTNKNLSFIPKPDWKKVAIYFFPEKFKVLPVLFETRHAKKHFLKYLRVELKRALKENKGRLPKDPLKSTIDYVGKDTLRTLSKNKYRSGFFLQTPEWGEMSALLKDNLFRSYFTLTASFPGVNVYRYDLPRLVVDDTHSLGYNGSNDMTLTRSQDINESILFLERGEYLIAFQPAENIQGQLSISIDGEEAVKTPIDSNGIGTFRFHTERELHRFVFRLLEPDTLRLKWFGIHRLDSNQVAFQNEDFLYRSPETKERWRFRFKQIRGRKMVGIYLNSFVGYYFALVRGGKFRLDLVGYNNLAGPVEVAVDLDGKRIGRFSFDKANRSWSHNRMSLSVSAGVHRIAFSYILDRQNRWGGRYAFLDRFELTRISEPAKLQ